MLVRTPRDLGLVIRERRRELGLNQSQLAARAGVGRQWIVAIEQGKPRAQLNAIIATLRTLGLRWTIHPEPESTTGDVIDDIIDEARRSR